jgi:hypothetical protein
MAQFQAHYDLSRIPRAIWIVLAVALYLVWWFALLHPLVPVTQRGWLVASGAGVVVAAWFVGAAWGIMWLKRQAQLVWACRALGGLLAISLGVVFFGSVLFAKDFVAANFSYFGG